MKNESPNRNLFSAPSVISPTNINRWNVIIQHQELLGLQKEVIHLEKKLQERPLSDWELERLSEVRQRLADSQFDEQLPQ